MEDSFEAGRGMPTRRTPAHPPFDARHFYWVLPGFSREALEVLGNPGASREEKLRVRNEYLESEAFDLMTGQTAPIRELVRFGADWQL